MAAGIELGRENWDVASSIFSTDSSIQPRKVPLGPGECETCLDTTLVWARRCCHVKICQDCLQTYVDGKIDDGVIDIKCPGHDCDNLLNQGVIRAAVDTVKAKRFSFLRVKSDRCKYKKVCPMCDNIVVLDDAFLQFYDNLESIIVCPNIRCRREWCFQCVVPWHEGYTCAEFKSFKTDTGVDVWARKLENSGGERNAQQCPNCQVWIQKIVGCYFMTCKECKTNFCYTCGAQTPHPIDSKCVQARTGVHGENQAGAWPAAPRLAAAPRPAAPMPGARLAAAPRPVLGRAAALHEFEIQDRPLDERLRRGHRNLLSDKLVDHFTSRRRDIMWFRCAIVFVFVFICFVGIIAHGMLEAYVRPLNN